MLKLASVLSPGKSELRGYLLYNKFTALQHLLTRDQDFSKVIYLLSYTYTKKVLPPYTFYYLLLLHSTSVFVKIPVNKERLRVEELVILLEEVVEIFRPIRRGSLEGETGHRAETELALLRGTLNNCDKIV